MPRPPMFLVGINAADAQRRHTEGTGYFGGWFRNPDYLRSYWLATEELFKVVERDTLHDELSIPMLYLQRHTLELAFKTLLSLIGEVREYCHHLDLHAGKPPTSLPTTPELKRLRTEHKLGVLLADLKAGLAAIGYPSLGTDVDDVVAAIEAVEARDETRFRYPSVRHPHAKGIQTQSFPDPVAIPLRQLQSLLIGVLTKYCEPSEDPYAPCSLLGDLHLEQEAVWQNAMAAGLDPETW